MTDQRLYLGTSGLVLPYKNSQAYPAAFEGWSRLRIYGTLFNSIEINSTFYKLPKASTITQWSSSVGDHFQFTFKLWKQITHNKSLQFEQPDLEKFFEVIDGANDKQGCILVQFPASVKQVLFGKVESLLNGIQKVNQRNWPIAVEFRDHSWYNEQTYELLNAYSATIVYHDKAGSTSPQPTLDAGHIYLRFHGPGGNYKGSYDQGLLFEYAGYISEWLNEGKTVYVYFNNTMGAALENLRTLEKFLKEEFLTDQLTVSTN
ncbi:hypothetical protein GCM10007423_26690 [Dyadobacter endophyticus]|uniref:DUF72 domain-containing protein n=1 Tax=Dyadobacter endophyticus TaxID=1749036 RepID=A0ABQ1YSV6_9BACT|nr:DUF72 domain-containing protein [Dyadobacter endophyticus]GGH35223.1 hypothetical protein GCM10007423_26690 [Dyadobacter endophyticus]